MTKLSLWQEFKASKKKYCNGTGSYKDMRSACKKYVDQAYNKAPYGKKTKTKLAARKRANVVLKSKCKL